ncbi:hypothetical protein D3C77_444910 [compost metagenome]
MLFSAMIEFVIAEILVDVDGQLVQILEKVAVERSGYDGFGRRQRFLPGDAFGLP